MSDPTLTLLNTDAIAGLKSRPGGSVQCAVTSPPYYGLRSYGTPPQIWGGRDGCDHTWRAKERAPWANGVKGPNSQGKNGTDYANMAKEAGQYCQHCEAWRGDLGGEPTPSLFIAHLVETFREVKRVLRDDGVLWLNLGDSYARAGGTDINISSTGKVGSTLRTLDQLPNRKQKVPEGLKEKDLIGIPWRVALALQEDGWYLRAACPWIKRNAMPESATDRPTTTIETIFMLTKSERYFYDAEAIKVKAKKGSAGSLFHVGKTAEHQQNRSSTKPRVEDGTRLRRSSDWFLDSLGMMQDDDGDPLAFVVNTKSYRGAHFATFPPDLIRPCIQASTSARGCCPTCGTPHLRTVKSQRVPDRPNRVQGRDGDSIEAAHGADGRAGNRCRVESTTLGWRQACDCAALPPTPCAVLDPFGGSGTTAQVALELGCHVTLIELNKSYLPLVQQRCWPALFRQRIRTHLHV